MSKNDCVAVDVKVKVEEIVNKLAKENVVQPLLIMCKEVKKMMDDKHAAWCGINDKQIMQRVQNRQQESNIGTLRLMEQLHIGKIKGSNQWFMNSNMTIV